MTRYDMRAEVSLRSGSDTTPHCPFCGSEMGKCRGQYECPRCFVEVRSSTYNTLGSSVGSSLKREPVASNHNRLLNTPTRTEAPALNRLSSSSTREQSFLSFLKSLRAFAAF